MDKKMVVGEILLEIKEIDRRLKQLEARLDDYLAQPDDASMAYQAPEAEPAPASQPAPQPVPTPQAETPAPDPVAEEEVRPTAAPRPSAPRVTRDGRYIADLRKAIGLNDRIRFVHGLFGGDASLMSATVETLNAQASFAEAEACLKARFNWDPQDETVVYFMDMLHKRFPNG